MLQNIDVDAYRILVIFPTATPHNAIKTVLERIKEMKGEDVKELVKAALRNSPELMWRFVNVAKRFGLLEKKASLSRREVEKLMSSFRLTPVYEEALREVLLEDIDLENLTRRDLRNLSLPLIFGGFLSSSKGVFRALR